MRQSVQLALVIATAVTLALAPHNVAAQRTKSHVRSSGLRPPPAPVEAIDPRVLRQTSPENPASEPFEAAEEPSGPPVEEGGSLHIMCFGRGSANKEASATAFGWGGNGDFGSATIFGQRSQGFEDQVSLRIDNGQGRLRMPRTMLPAVRGGEDGWFKLKDIKMKPNEITASVAVNVINNPKLRLDRYSGAISISGKAGDYAGQCRRFNPETMQRKF